MSVAPGFEGTGSFSPGFSFFRTFAGVELFYLFSVFDEEFSEASRQGVVFHVFQSDPSQFGCVA